MSDITSNNVSAAIAEQVATRTPAPTKLDEEVDVANTRNFLNERQRAVLDEWCTENAYGLIGQQVIMVTKIFNDTIAYHSEFFKAGEETKRITVYNLLFSLRKLGLSQGNSSRIVAVSASVFAPQPNVAAATSNLPPGVEAVTKYRGDDGRLYDTIEEARDASFISEFAQFIYENQVDHDESSSKELARRIAKVYNISRK